MAKMVPGRKEYVDDVSEQDKADYAEWLEAQSEETDGADEGEFSVARWLKGRKAAAMSGIKIQYDLNNVNLALTTGSCCPYGDYGAVVTGVKKRYTESGYAYVLLRFELRIRMAEGESVQVFYPTMVRWLRTSDGRTPKKLEKVLEAFGYSHAKEFRRLIGKKVALTIAKGDDFGWNGKNHKMARVKSMQPYGATVVRKSYRDAK